MGNLVGKEITQEDVDQYLPAKASELSLLNDNESYLTPYYMTNRLQKIKASQISRIDDDSVFTTPNWVNKYYMNMKASSPSDLNSDSKFVTGKFLNDNLPQSATSGNVGYATPQFVLDNNKIDINPEQADEIGLYLVENDIFAEKVGNAVSKNTQEIPTNIASKLLDGTRKDIFLGGITSNILDSDVNSKTLIDKLSTNLTTTSKYRQQLRGEKGDITDPTVLETSVKPRTMWCADGQLCEIPDNSPGFKLKANQTISSSAENKLVKIDRNLQIPGELNFLTNDLRSSTSYTGKFGSTDGLIQGINNTEGADGLTQAKNSYLSISGLGKNYQDGTTIKNIKKQVKIEDDVNITNNLKITGGEQLDLFSPNGNLRINKHGIMFGGENDTTREGNSAQITAGMHEDNSLNIVGMSDGNKNNRRVRVWAEGGFIVNDRDILAELNSLRSDVNKKSNNGHQHQFHAPGWQEKTTW